MLIDIDAQQRLLERRIETLEWKRAMTPYDVDLTVELIMVREKLSQLKRR